MKNLEFEAEKANQHLEKTLLPEGKTEGGESPETQTKDEDKSDASQDKKSERLNDDVEPKAKDMVKKSKDKNLDPKDDIETRNKNSEPKEEATVEEPKKDK